MTPPLPQPYTILIADDHRMFSDAVCQLLRPVYKEVGQVFDGAELLHAVRKSPPDVLLLDINLPKVHGLEAARQIRHSYPRVCIIVVTMYNQQRMVREVRELGLDGYILKDSSSQELLSGIRSVIDGNTYFDPKLEQKKGVEDLFSNSWMLTRRENQVIEGLVAGKKATQLAEELGLTYETVKSHRKNIYLKLEINSLAELIRLYSAIKAQE